MMLSNIHSLVHSIFVCAVNTDSNICLVQSINEIDTTFEPYSQHKQTK